MWISVLILAVAVNFEPTRPTLVPLMLARPRPILQLVALFIGSFGMGLLAGVLVLFVFHQTPLGSSQTNGAKIQLVIGSIALVAAALTASRISFPGFSRFRPRSLASAQRGLQNADAESGADAESAERPMDKVANRARAILRKGNSPVLSCLLGMGIGLPSVDYMAVLVVIGASGTSPAVQLGALLTFLLLGNVFIAVPLISFLLAPERTRAWIAQFQTWVRARTRRDFAVVVAIVGVIQILLGVTSLWSAGV